MIELAPQNKIGLSIDSPLMPAAGFFGYGQPLYPHLIQAGQFGALVTNPITLRPRPHQAWPQVIETSGGFITNTPPRNPGVKKVIQQYRKFWGRASCPLIAHLPADDPADLARTAGALAGLDLLSGFELGLPHGLSPNEVTAMIKAIWERSELPLLVKLPTPDDLSLAEAALAAGADALVINLIPPGRAYTPVGVALDGAYYGAGIVAQRLPAFSTCQRHFPDISLIASGGVHTTADVEAYLRAGATAVQLDSLIFTNPERVQQIMRQITAQKSDTG